MAGKMKINNNNGKLVVIENPDTNNTNITIDGSQLVVKNDVYTKTQSDNLLGNKVSKISSPTTNALVKVNADGSISNSNIVQVNGITVIPNGIKFENISTDPTVLDAYQEGTWSPTVYGSATSGTCTYTVRIGAYTRIGNRCFYSIYVGWSGHTGTGALAIDLPFINKNVTFSAGAIAYLSYSFNTGELISCFSESLNHLMFVKSISTSITSLNIQSSGTVMVSGSYIIQE